jgi:MFS family permease
MAGRHDARPPLVSCFIIGSGMALFGPAWQASVSEQVSAKALPSAVALNGISYNIARNFGTAIGGVIVTLYDGRPLRRPLPKCSSPLTPLPLH